MGISYNPSIVRQGLVMYVDAANSKSYPGSGTALNDLSGGENNGVLTNGPSFNSESLGNLTFDGTNDYVEIPHTSALNAFPLTMTAWIYITSTANNIDIINKYISGSVNGYRMGITQNGIGIYYFAGSIDQGLSNYDFGSGAVVANQWNMVTASVNASGGIIYINAQQVGTRSWVGTPAAPTSTTPFRLGHYPPVNGYFNGKIANAAIYNRALTAQEIRQNFKALRGRFGV